MTFPTELTCLKCGKTLANFQPGVGVQPIGGLSLESPGHYGSAFFDPCGNEVTGSTLHVVVCDECLDEVEKGRNQDSPAVVRSRVASRSMTTYERVT